MSLLHDALKKAERQRQLGKAPTLDSPRFRRRRRRWPWFIVLLLVAGLVGAWVWRQPLLHKARATYAYLRGAPSAPTPQQAAAPDKGTQTLAAEKQPPQSPSARPAPSAHEGASVPGASNKSDPDKKALAQKARPDAQAPSRASVPAPAQNAAVNNAAPAPAQPKPGQKAQLAQAAAHPPPPPPKLTQGQLKSKPPPMYWELPYAERKDLPDFDISMHVYTDDPADRFVILNGLRQVEGDTLTSGQKLIAINPDSITLEDNGHTFRVPRQGGH